MYDIHVRAEYYFPYVRPYQNKRYILYIQKPPPLGEEPKIRSKIRLKRRNRRKNAFITLRKLSVVYRTSRSFCRYGSICAYPVRNHGFVHIYVLWVLNVRFRTYARDLRSSREKYVKYERAFLSRFKRFYRRLAGRIKTFVTFFLSRSHFTLN